MVFLPQKKNQREFCIESFETEIKKRGLVVLGWRRVPVNKKVVGRIASKTEPFISQVFVGKGNSCDNNIEFNAKLYIARKITEHVVYLSLIHI